MPVSEACRNKQRSLEVSNSQLAQGGDDYELCFTVPENKISMLSCTCDELGLKVTDIGMIEPEPGLRCYEAEQLLTITEAGYQHFKE